MKLEMKNVVCGFRSWVVVNGFSMVVSSGDVVCLLGPNGVGKSTLFRTIQGFLKPLGGEIMIDGRSAQSLSRKEFARLVGYVPQVHSPPFPFSVMDVVMMGRTAHIGSFGSPGRRDREVAVNMLDKLGIGFLVNRTYTETSGGERQMVLIARALAQEPSFLLLDEPTSNLDFGNQVRVLGCIRDLAKKDGLGVIMTTHFPDHVFQCEGDVALMEWNNVFVAGKAENVITSENMRNTYGIEVRVMKNQIDDMTVNSCVPVIRR